MIQVMECIYLVVCKEELLAFHQEKNAWNHIRSNKDKYKEIPIPLIHEVPVGSYSGFEFED